MRNIDKIFASAITLISIVLFILFIFTNRVTEVLVSSYNLPSIISLVSFPIWFIYIIGVMILGLSLYFSKHEKIWLAALLFLIFTSSALVYYLSGNLEGHDSWLQASFAQSIFNSKSFTITALSSNGYPGYYILISSVSLILHLSTETILQVFTPLMVTFFYFLLYITLKHWIDNKWALLSALSFFMVNISLGAIFNPVFLSMCFFVLLLNLFTSKNLANYFLSIVLITIMGTLNPVVAFLSIFMLIFLVLASALSNKVPGKNALPLKISFLLLLTSITILTAWTLYFAPNLLSNVLSQATVFFKTVTYGISVPNAPVRPFLSYLLGSVLKNYAIALLAFCGFIGLALKKNSRTFGIFVSVWLGIIAVSYFLLSRIAGSLNLSLWTNASLGEFLYFPLSIMVGYSLFLLYNFVSTSTKFNKQKFLKTSIKKILLTILIIFIIFECLTTVFMSNWYVSSQEVDNQNIATWNFLKLEKGNYPVLAFHPTVAFTGQNILQEFVYYGSVSFQGLTTMPTPFYTANMTEYNLLIARYGIGYIVFDSSLNKMFYDQIDSKTSDGIFIQLQNQTQTSSDMAYCNGEFQVFIRK